MLAIILFIGTTELLLIGGLALLLFGGKKLPELMKGIGQGVRSFKKGMSEPVEDNVSETSTAGSQDQVADQLPDQPSK